MVMAKLQGLAWLRRDTASHAWKPMAEFLACRIQWVEPAVKPAARPEKPPRWHSANSTAAAAP
jgi:hypothetical protein